MNDYSRSHELLAQAVEVLHPVGQVAEVAPAAVSLLVPVVGKFHQGCLPLAGGFDITGCRQEHQGKAPLLVLGAADLRETELAAEEVQGLIKVGDPNHG